LSHDAVVERTGTHGEWHAKQVERLVCLRVVGRSGLSLLAVLGHAVCGGDGGQICEFRHASGGRDARDYQVREFGGSRLGGTAQGNYRIAVPLDAKATKPRA